MVSFAQLITPESASAENHDDSRAQEAKEDAHACAQCTSRPAAEVSKQVVTEKHAEEDEDGDLQGETGHGDVDTGLAGALADGREGSSGGLEGEADNVGGDKYPPD